jgi:cold shock CspA family protein
MDTSHSSTLEVPASPATVSADTTKYTGRVKWFNNKSGYGFITVVSADTDGLVASGLDVFAHHSEITVGEDQYRYLVQGEYVEFSVCKTSSGHHEFQCSNISGIRGGQLICETRHAAREQYKTTTSTTNPLAPLSSNALHRGSGRGDGFAGSRSFRGRGAGPAPTRGGVKQ